MIKNSHGSATAVPAPQPSSVSAELAQEMEQLQKERQALRAEREQLRRQHIHYLLVKEHGLDGTQQNAGMLDYLFPGDKLTIEAVHQAWKQGTLYGMTWTSTAFAQYEANQRQQSETINSNRRMFDTVCAACTAQGVNTAASDSNYQIVQNYIAEVGGNYSMQWLTSRIMDGSIAGLHPNNEEQTSSIDTEARTKLWLAVNESLRYRDNRGNWNYRNDRESQQIRALVMDQLTYAEVKQRVSLCRTVAETVSRDAETRNKEFARLLLQTARPVSELQATVDKIQQAREFRKLPVSELKNVVRTQQAASLPAPTTPLKTLPPEFTRRRILQASIKDLQDWIRKFGLEAVNNALDGRK